MRYIAVCPALIFLIIIDCINATEIASNNRPMVQNPIYDGTAIYEEIPGDRKNFRSLPQPTPQLASCDREECYVSITNPMVAKGGDFEFLASEKSDLVHNFSRTASISYQPL